MYNFNLIVDFGENIVHNRRYGLAWMNLNLKVYISALFAFIKSSLNVIWMYEIALKNQIKFFLWKCFWKFDKFRDFGYNIYVILYVIIIKYEWNISK